MQMEAATSPLLPIAGHPDPQRGVDSPFVAPELEPLIREELARILKSRIFNSSIRMKRFIRFVVEATLEGRADCLKEYLIGTEVYDRKPPYEPSQDSIVRTEARRLRGKLKEYYEAEGKMDPIIISFHTGSYVPVFAARERLKSDSPELVSPVKSISSELPEALVIVILFNDSSGDTLVEDCARAISEGIALKRAQGLNHKPAAVDPQRMARLVLVK